MIDDAINHFGGIHILINNAGILRDQSFKKASMDDMKLILDVHLMGSVYTTKAAWQIMCDQQYGRVVMTTSPSGLFGNFGQANYAAAKAGMVGLMNVLAEEGRKTNIRVNTISPTAATRMTEGLIGPEILALMKPEAITPAVLYLLSEDAPTRTIMGAGAGSFAVIKVVETEGLNLPQDQWTPDAIAANFAKIGDMSTARDLGGAFFQTFKYVEQAAKAAGIKLPAMGG
jgi:NAD(P)-dependent dehydrogenase (short-subunit alcohol dehydrogenase family)